MEGEKLSHLSLYPILYILWDISLFGSIRISKPEAKQQANYFDSISLIRVGLTYSSLFYLFGSTSIG